MKPLQCGAGVNVVVNGTGAVVVAKFVGIVGVLEVELEAFDVMVTGKAINTKQGKAHQREKSDFEPNVFSRSSIMRMRDRKREWPNYVRPPVHP